MEPLGAMRHLGLAPAMFPNFWTSCKKCMASPRNVDGIASGNDDLAGVDLRDSIRCLRRGWAALGVFWSFDEGSLLLTVLSLLLSVCGGGLGDVACMGRRWADFSHTALVFNTPENEPLFSSYEPSAVGPLLRCPWQGLRGLPFRCLAGGGGFGAFQCAAWRFCVARCATRQMRCPKRIARIRPFGFTLVHC